MKKEIIINASKDRSRIAIVEDGQLAELYVENPDNVRTLGNIYLARIRKVMPAIRAAFVDVGQKQDAFLHFSDLTDNLPALLAITGEQLPANVARTLSTAPQKRVADDESEPEVEEKLELGDPTAPAKTRRTPSGRGRAGRRFRGEEEEEQEETTPRRRLPHVIDLTSKAGRLEAPRPASPPPAPVVEEPARPAEAAPTDAVGVELATTVQDEAASPPRRRGGRRAAPAPAAAEATDPEASAGEAPRAADEGTTPAPRRPSRRGKTAAASAGARDAATEGEAVAPTESEPSVPPDAVEADAAATVADTEGVEEDAEAEEKKRRRRGRRGGRRRRRAGEVEAEGDPDIGDSAEPHSEPGDEEAVEAAAPPAGEPATAPTRRGGRRAPTAGSGASAEEPGQTERRRGRRAAEPTAAPEAPASTPAANGAAPARPVPPVRTRERGEPARATARAERSAAPAAPARPGRPDDLLRHDGRILVKITKEPISAKGSRVSTDISLAGRFLVLVPAADYVAVSKKISTAKERRRLRTLAESLKPDGFGVIVRTVAEDRDAKTLDNDLRLLVEKWRKIEKQLEARPEPPVLLYEDVSMVSSIVRDLFTDDFDRIVVDDPKVHRNLKAYVQAVAPHMAERVVQHRQNTPLFRAFGIERQVEEVFSPRVGLPSGGYLYIEHTEAMHVVDVNSGRAGRGLSQNENILRVNLEAAREVAHQLRLRDLGGIIVVDFIDMYGEADRRKVYNALKDEFKKDRAVTKLLPMSDFGLIEITRQRLRPSLTATATAATAGDGAPADPSDPASLMAAVGAGEIEQPERRYEAERRAEPAPPEVLAERIERWLQHYQANVTEKYRDREIALVVHPLLAAFLTRKEGVLGLVGPSRLKRWRKAFRGLPFKLEEDPSADPLAFAVRDEKSGKPITSKYTPG